MEINNILDLIRNIALFRKNYINFISKALSNFDITTSEFAYLKEVINCDGIAQDELIRNLSIDKAAATRIAQSLEKKGVIERIRNEHNKRFFNVFLTDEGKKFLPLVKETLNNFYELFTTKVSSSDFEIFKNVLRQFNNNF